MNYVMDHVPSSTSFVIDNLPNHLKGPKTSRGIVLYPDTSNLKVSQSEFGRGSNSLSQVTTIPSKLVTSTPLI